MKASPALIAVDWGTSAFRACLMARDGAVRDRRENASGILTVRDGAFAPVLDLALAPWVATHGKLPIIMSGMIGSRQGWREAAYVPCPVRIADIAGALLPLPPDATPSGCRIAIVPGVTTRDAAGVPDVMRGEETQIFGALERLGVSDGVFVLPGTHSKWVTVAGGAITGFATYMTGEVFAALKQHTILGRMMQDGGPSSAGFERGLAAASKVQDGPGVLLRQIFSVRTLGLSNELAGAEQADYLSGLLIGAEIRAASAGQDSVVVIGNEALTARYATALRSLGIEPVAAPPDCAAAGIVAIARAAAIV